MNHRAQKRGQQAGSGKFWSLGRSIAAAGTALLLLVSGGVGAAVAAPPYTTEATVSNIKFVNTEVTNGSQAEMTADWSLPNNPTPPAGMTIALPPELAGRGDTFVITAQDTGATIATCVARATQLECDFDNAYISDNSRNLHGTVNFWVIVKKDVDQSQQETFTVNGQVVTVTVNPGGGTCTTNCDFLWDNRKEGSYDYEKNEISWYVHVEAPEAGMTAGQTITVKDTPGPGQTLTVTDTNPTLLETTETGPRSDGSIRPQNWKVVPRTDYTVDPNDGTVTFTTKQGYYYQVKYITKVTDSGATGTYTNKADFTVNGQSNGGAEGNVRYAGGGGTGIGENVGIFSITKKVEGDAQNLPSDLKFTGTYTVTSPAGDVQNGSFEVAANDTWTSGEFPRDSVVHLNEVTPTSPSNINWATPKFSKNDFTLEGGKLAEIELTNTATVKLGKFSAAKSFDGTEAAQDLVPENATFDLDYSYPAGVGFPAGSGTLTIGADGKRVVSDDLPMGAEVTVTEKTPAPVDGIDWGTPVISPSSFTIGDDIEIAIQVTNPVTENLGGFSLKKTVSGNAATLVPADAKFDVDYSWKTEDGKSGEDTITVTRDGKPVVVDGLPQGAVVTLTEQKATPIDGVVWGKPVFSKNEFTVEPGATVEVSLDNPTTKTPEKPTTPTTPEKPTKPGLPVTGTGDGAMLGLAGVAGLMLAAGAVLMARKRIAARR